MQMAVIEAARNLLNIKNASTSEFGNNCTPVVGLLEEWQKGNKKLKDKFRNGKNCKTSGWCNYCTMWRNSCNGNCSRC